MKQSKSVMAVAFAPASDPLWAMGVAMAMASAQWWPLVPGMFAGKRNTTVGMFQEISAISSEPPPQEKATEPLMESGFVRSPSMGLPWLSFLGASTSCCTARAMVWSLSSQAGIPTFLMLAYMASASGLLKCPGQAVPRI